MWLVIGNMLALEESDLEYSDKKLIGTAKANLVTKFLQVDIC